MSLLTDIATALTGTDVNAELENAQQQLTVAIGTMIGLEVIIALELFVLMVMTWKERH